MRNTGNNSHDELLDSLQQRIQTEKSIFKRRLESPTAEVEEPAHEEGSLRPTKRRLDQRPPAPDRPRSQERRRRPRRTGRLYQVFLALGVPEAES